MTAAAVRVLTSAAPREFVAFVDIGSGEVRVRFNRSESRDQWRCDDCGRHRFSTCPHETAARKAWQNTRTTDPHTKENTA
ncbi:hypothetical protein BH11ACT1_BH11ACT1_19250 [soil metagenome]